MASTQGRRVGFGLVAFILFMLLAVCLWADFSGVNTTGKSLNLSFGWNSSSIGFCTSETSRITGWPLAHTRPDATSCNIEDNTLAVLGNWLVYAATALGGVVALAQVFKQPQKAAV